MLAKRHDLRFGTCIDYFRFELDLTRFCNQFTCNVKKVFYLLQVIHAAVDVYVIDKDGLSFVGRLTNLQMLERRSITSIHHCVLIAAKSLHNSNAVDKNELYWPYLH